MSLPTNEATPTSTKLPQTQRMTDKAEQPVDARFRRLKAKILPESPYILHVRTTYRQNPEHANLWRTGTHFELNEEELQYLTFKDRTNDTTPGLFCRGGWDDGRGGLAPPEEPYSRTSSDGTPLQGQGRKKKISLADYNRRDKNKTVAITTKPASPKTAEPPKDNATVKETDTTVRASKSAQVEYHSLKRSANAVNVGKDTIASDQCQAGPSAKKARTASEPPSTVSAESTKITTQKMDIEIGVARDLSDAQKVKSRISSKTGRISIGEEPGHTKTSPKRVEEKLNLHGLPPMLSPTLPSEIEEELAKLNPGVPRHSRSIARSKTPNATSKLKQHKTEHTGSSTDDGDANSSAEGAMAAINSSVKHRHSQSHVTPASRQAAKRALSNGLSPTKRNGFLVSPVTAPVTTSTTPQRIEKRRLRTLLKIKKKTNRKNLAQYLRLPPTPGKYPHLRRIAANEQRSRTPQSEQMHANSLHGSRPINQLKSKHNDSEALGVSEKQRRSPDRRDELELQAKRHKIPARLPQNAHTPKQPPTSSPALSNVGSAPKPQMPTPQTDLKSVPMLRAESREGSTTTPRGLALNGTPNITDTGNRCNSVTSSSGRRPNSQDVRRDAAKYLKQATDLKHASDGFLKGMSNMSDIERKRGVMIGTECVLCYILAFTLFDEPQRQFGQYGNDEGWKSMLRLLDVINREAQPFRHLAGLLLQLEGIIRDYMVCYGFQRLDYNPLEHRLSDTVASDPSKTTEENKAAAYHGSFHEFRRYFEKSQNAWRSGLDLLRLSDIESEYPMTWAKRERHLVLPVKSADAVSQGEYQRKFNLPLGSMSSGLQAVSFGMSFLQEWSKKNGVKWEPKLEL